MPVYLLVLSPDYGSKLEASHIPVGAATKSRIVKVAGIVQYGGEKWAAAIFGLDRESVEHGRSPTAVAVWRQLDYCRESTAEDVPSGIHSRSGGARRTFVVERLLRPARARRTQLVDD